MNEVFLMIGSNLGDRHNNLYLAIILIEERLGKVFRKSSVYETEPFGIKEQPSFLNKIISVLNDNNPQIILATILEIEKILGRERTVKWAERIIDIDILFFGNKIINESNLIIPHEGIEFRRFTLIPLDEIIPDFTHPKIHETIHEILEVCNDSLAVVMVGNGNIESKLKEIKSC